MGAGRKLEWYSGLFGSSLLDKNPIFPALVKRLRAIEGLQGLKVNYSVQKYMLFFLTTEVYSLQLIILNFVKTTQLYILWKSQMVQ